MLCGLLRLIPLVLLFRLLSLILLLVPLLILLLLRLPLIRRATFTVAIDTSTAIKASTFPAPPALAAASSFETSGQGMTAVGPVRALAEILHADEATLQVAQTEIRYQSKSSFLGSIRRGDVILRLHG